MRSSVSLASLLSLLVMSVGAFAQSSGDELAGYWYSEGNESIIQIEKVGGKFNGKIAWIAEPVYEKGDPDEGKPKYNREDRDKSRRHLPIVGLNMIEGFSFDSKGKKWKGGTIYDPESGKTYKCEMKFEDDEENPGSIKLYVRGYIGVPALGRTTYWRPTPKEDLVKHELVEADKE